MPENSDNYKLSKIPEIKVEEILKYPNLLKPENVNKIEVDKYREQVYKSKINAKNILEHPYLSNPDNIGKILGATNRIEIFLNEDRIYYHGFRVKKVLDHEILHTKSDLTESEIRKRDGYIVNIYNIHV